MPVILSAKVARTAHDLKHVNRLRVPTFGVTELRLVTADGKKKSKSYSPEGYSAASGGSDAFHFAPEKEKVKVVYKIEDPFKRIKKAKLELFRRYDATALWTRDLKPEEFADGEHTLEWDGRLDKEGKITDADESKFLEGYFPDGYVTVEHSPYKLKITLGGEVKGSPPTAWTYFHILVADIDLELGAKEVLSSDRDKAVYDSLNGTLPLPGGKKKRKVVPLTSNIFKIASNEMTNNTAYLEYRGMWGNGPNIPIFAKVWIRDSKDRKVEAPKALGNVKFLWDWEDVREDTARHHPAARAFIDDALNYDTNTTQPKGDNCHIDRGGKRGPQGRPVFPTQAGYKPTNTLTNGVFPFKVEACPNRRWAAFSYAWRSGKLAGKTGVLFQPSRMAGDAYKVTVYLAYDKKSDGSVVLDVTDDAPLPAAIKKSTGIFEIWRKVEIVRYLKKNNNVRPNINLATVANYYEKAYLLLHNAAGAPGIMNKMTYNNSIAACRNISAWYIQAAIDPAVDQYDAGGHFIHFRDHDDWKAQVDAHALAQGWTDAQKQAWSNALGDPYNDADVYYDLLSNWAIDFIERVCGSFMDAKQGVNIFQFHNLYNPTLPGGTRLNGFAANPPGSNRNKCGFIQCGSNYGGTLASGQPNRNTREQTCTHEIGHQLFLPHTWQVSAAHDPQGFHDSNDDACTMSYEFDKVRRFCGLCLLRLRGWSVWRTNANGAAVAPPVRTLNPIPPNSKT